MIDLIARGLAQKNELSRLSDKVETAKQLSGGSNCIAYGADVNNPDNTLAIQTALNIGGYVYLYKPGAYLIDGTLLIGSNTTLELGEGVVIKRGGTVGKNLLKNSNVINGNTNINITGGNWDYSFPTVSAATAHDTHAIVLQKVTGLTINNVKVLHAQKYAWLVADCYYISVDELDFDTSSDGLHLMGPINFADIRNLKGKTGDNLLAFTIGDYNTYELSRGNMTNITASGIYCDDSAEPVRLVGNPGYYFDNIVIEKITGTVISGRVVAVIQDTDLTYTDVRNLKIKDIYCNPGISEQIFLNCMNGENISIENVGTGTATVVKIATSANIKNLELKNLTVNKDLDVTPVIVEGIIDTFKIDSLYLVLIAGSTGSSILITPTSTINNLFIKNVKQVNGTNFINANGIINKIYIDNFDFTGISVIFVKNKGGITTISFNNGYATYLARFITTSATASDSLRVLANNIQFSSDASSRFSANAVCPISLNGITFRAKDLALLTPKAGDMAYNTEPTFGTGVGVYLFDTAWRKL